MARNQEKAQTMLSRFLRYKGAEKSGGPAKRRPHLAEECDNLSEANKWRGQIIREIKRGVAEIQNASLGEHKIRDLNDKINKLFREKYHWERRIRDLGGHNYIRSSKKITNDDEVLLGHNGVRYFGAARYLPGVKEFLEVKLKERAAPKRVTRGELYNRINPDYFGFGDDDDGLLRPLEEAAEKRLRLERINRWRQKKGMPKLDSAQAIADAEANKRPWKSHVNIPTEEEIQKQLLEQRKKMILKRYMTDGPESRRLAAHDNAEENRQQMNKAKEADKENTGPPPKKRRKTNSGKSVEKPSKPIPEPKKEESPPATKRTTRKRSTKTSPKSKTSPKPKTKAAKKTSPKPKKKTTSPKPKKKTSPKPKKKATSPKPKKKAPKKKAAPKPKKKATKKKAVKKKTKKAAPKKKATKKAAAKKKPAKGKAKPKR